MASIEPSIWWLVCPSIRWVSNSSKCRDSMQIPWRNTFRTAKYGGSTYYIQYALYRSQLSVKFSDMALSVLNRASGSVWIGAKRTAACTRNGISSQCTATNSFYWTDNSASGIAGFVRAHQQPDNAHGKTQLWAILLSSRTSLRVKHVMWQPGMLDDVACVMNPSDPSPRAVSGYVCGKKSSRR